MTADNTRPPDFPDWLGPMLVKELRQGMKARGFEITFIVLQILLAVVLSFHALLYVKSGSQFNSSGLSSIFWTIVSLQLLAVTPLRALGGLANERKANTLELIFMSGLSSWRITWGKWVSLQFQSILFVLAVLPYGLLRYFFGGVNLTEDLVLLGWVMVGSGVLSALALAISGMPAFARIGTVLMVAFFGMSFVSTMIARVVMGGGGPSIGFGWTELWPLAVFDILLIALGALELGASTIAPIAENHAMRQRCVVLAAFVPVPVLKWIGAPDSVVIPQIVFFGTMALALSWWHLATVPTSLRVQIEPFSKRGVLGFLGGCFLQPGWPSAVLFLVLSEALLLTAGLIAAPRDFGSAWAVFVMAGAALLTPAVIWNILRTGPKQLLLKHTLVLIVCGGIMAFAHALDTSRDFAFGHQLWPALLPPFGFWAMLDRGLESQNVATWQMAGFVMLLLQAALLYLMASGYWARMLTLHREIVASKKIEIAPEEVSV